jgi:translation initiation factor IF-3
MALPNRPFNRPGGGRFQVRKEAEHRINHFIRVPQVRLVGDNVTMGVYSTQDALSPAVGIRFGGNLSTSRSPCL